MYLTPAEPTFLFYSVRKKQDPISARYITQKCVLYRFYVKKIFANFASGQKCSPKPRKNAAFGKDFRVKKCSREERNERTKIILFESLKNLHTKKNFF